MKYIILLLFFIQSSTTTFLNIPIIQNDLKHPEFEAAKIESYTLDKPLLILFTTHLCAAPQATSDLIDGSEKIKSILHDKYVFLELFVDDKAVLPDEVKLELEKSNHFLRNKGQLNAVLEMQKFNQNSQPYYVIIDNMETLYAESKFIKTEKGIIDFLSDGLNKYYK